MSKFYEYIDESVWSDIQDRSTGDQIRKEDEIPANIKKVLDAYMNIFAHKEAFAGNYTLGSYPDFRAFIKDFANAPKIQALDFDMNELLDYVKENWNDVVLPRLNDVVTKINGEVDKAVDQLLDDLHQQEDIKESVWSDIQDRSTGEMTRKEDEMNEDDFHILREISKMFTRGLNRLSERRNNLKGFVRYIDELRQDHFITMGSTVVPDEVYKKIIKFVEDHWEDKDWGIIEFSKKYLHNLNECEGVPGGATPANVGGMGAAYLPGPNGEPGSGDLPSPTGKVYQQVAPFGIFVNSLYGKKKKKKKKFRKEDEPCVHSPNAKVYDYVDDFRDYVDRTYNNIDKK